MGLNKILVVTTVSLFSVFAFAEGIVLQSKTMVGFAPPEMRGTYTVQIKDNGQVLSIDNKSQKVVLAKLSKPVMKALLEKVEKLEIQDLQGEEGPGCYDAPTTEVSVFKAEKEVIIKTVVACKTKEMFSAYELNSMMNSAIGIRSILNK
jgi:hypothetical protein